MRKQSCGCQPLLREDNILFKRQTYCIVRQFIIVHGIRAGICILLLFLKQFKYSVSRAQYIRTYTITYERTSPFSAKINLSVYASAIIYISVYATTNFSFYIFIIGNPLSKVHMDVVPRVFTRGSRSLSRLL